MLGLIPRWIKQLYVSFFNWFVCFIAPEDFNDVLILRLDELGDFVLWLDSAKEFRKIYPQKKLTLLVNEKWIELAKALPYWDDVLGLNTIRFKIDPFYRLKWLFFIRKQGFDIVICPRWSVKFTLEPAIVATCSAEQKIVYEGTFPTEKKNYWTNLIPSTPWSMHELNRNADFIRYWLPGFRSSVPKLYIPLKVPRSGITICPLSYRRRKQWPIKNYNEIVQKLKDQQVYVITKEMDLMAFISQIAHSKLVIANDSAPIHIATALDVPSICIGAENHGRFVPYSVEQDRPGQVLPKVIYHPDVKKIPVDLVWEMVKGILNGY